MPQPQDDEITEVPHHPKGSNSEPLSQRPAPERSEVNYGPNSDHAQLLAQLEGMERQFNAAKKIGVALIVVILLLAGLLLQVLNRVKESERSVNSLPTALAQAADKKLSEMTPKLEQRLQSFEKLAAKMQSDINGAEDRIMARVEKQTPQILDAYFQAKLEELRKEAERLKQKALSR